MVQVITPQSPAQMDAYYYFRWQMLNQPLQQPLGSERDAYDAHSIHRMVLNRKRQIVAVGRIFISDNQEALIRYVAVHPDLRQRGYGSMLMMALEDAAYHEGVSRIVVNARAVALNFFLRCGFVPTGSETFDKTQLKHQQLVKELNLKRRFFRQPVLCQQLQELLEEQLPMAEKMGAKLRQYTGRQLITSLPLAGNQDINGRMFSGSLYNLAVLSAWAMLWLMLREQGGEGEILLLSGRVRHHHGVFDDAVAKVRREHMRGHWASVLNGRRGRFKLEVELLSQSERVGLFQGRFLIAPPSA